MTNQEQLAAKKSAHKKIAKQLKTIDFNDPRVTDLMNESVALLTEIAALNNEIACGR